jgi:hypothetical protein
MASGAVMQVFCGQVNQTVRPFEERGVHVLDGGVV